MDEIDKLLRAAEEKKTQIIDCYEFPEDFKPRMGCDIPSSGNKPPKLRQIGSTAPFARRKVLEACFHLGTYGMGGPGFFGVQLEATQDRPQEWLILCLWGCDSWLIYDGLPVYALKEQNVKHYGIKEAEQDMKNKLLESFELNDKSCCMRIGGKKLELDEKPDRRPLYAGNLQPRVLSPNDSLWDAWVVSQKGWLVV